MDALGGLIEREGEPLVAMLPRTPGRKDSEYMHLFCGPIDIEAYSIQAKVARTSERISVSELARRVSKLEAEVAELKERGR